MRITVLLLLAIFGRGFALERPGVEFRVFQFPADKIPRIDGDASDWSIVPETYSIGIDQLKETTKGGAFNYDKKDLDVKGEGRLGERPQPPVLPLRGIRQLLGLRRP